MVTKALDPKRPEKFFDDKGRTMGLEPTSGGTTILCLNHLATPAIIWINTIASGLSLIQYNV
jgi:hypothetical protein